MADELVEELARRFYAVAREVGGPMPLTKAWMAVASEAIRQMEWARRCVGAEMSHEPLGGPVYQTTVRAKIGALTFAPPDWKPE